MTGRTEAAKQRDLDALAIIEKYRSEVSYGGGYFDCVLPLNDPARADVRLAVEYLDGCGLLVRDQERTNVVRVRARR